MRHSDTPDQDEDWRKNALDPFDSNEFYLLSIKGESNVGISVFRDCLESRRTF